MTTTATPLRSFFSYFGAKGRIASHYPKPKYKTIIEPFAGSAGYSLLYHEREVILVEKDPKVAALWEFLIGASPQDVLDIPIVEHTDDLGENASLAVKTLVGLLFGVASAVTRKKPSPFRKQQGGGLGGGWTVEKRAQIASQVNAIKHWKVICGDYTSAPDIEATWHIDPPYQKAGGHYRMQPGSFEALGAWCRERKGQVMVCENAGADWLPFRPFFSIAGASGRSTEAIWTNEPDFGNRSEYWSSEVETVLASELNPAPYNPRRISPEDLQKLKRSIREFGFVEPVVARREDRLLIGGHQRLRALLSVIEEDLGDVATARVPVVWLHGISDTKAKALNLALNKIRGQWDTVKLAELLEELSVADLDVSLTGFAERERVLLAQVLHDEKVRLARSGVVVAGEDPEIGELPEEDDGCDSEPGKVYQLGPHRLACGDSTDRAAWDALLEDERLAMVWTDPPYGIAYKGGLNKPRSPIHNDALSHADLRRLLSSALGIAEDRCESGATWYVASPSGPTLGAFASALTELGVWRQTLVWMKDKLVFGRSDYHYIHETIFYGWKEGRHVAPPERTNSSVLQFGRPAKSDLHPTMKPVELVRFCIANSSRPGAIVGDPFGGSGTTLIAAAYEGRVARLIELDRRYCDAIRRRWTAFAESAGLEPGSGALR